ncbi:hypothetical protein DFH09DRAFT_1083580 [Mycena vulgaris]|nr:hypothetical protein DFH09DRAFT_1083580 [Mycena vulgaris]
MSDSTTSAYHIQHLLGEENYATWEGRVDGYFEIPSNASDGIRGLKRNDEVLMGSMSSCASRPPLPPSRQISRFDFSPQLRGTYVVLVIQEEEAPSIIFSPGPI